MAHEVHLQEALKEEIKVLIVEALMLDDVTPAEIKDDAPLFIDGLGLDSIDALELSIALNDRYGIKIDAEDERIREWFASVSALAHLVRQHVSQQESDSPVERRP